MFRSVVLKVFVVSIYSATEHLLSGRASEYLHR